MKKYLKRNKFSRLGLVKSKANCAPMGNGTENTSETLLADECTQKGNLIVLDARR